MLMFLVIYAFGTNDQIYFQYVLAFLRCRSQRPIYFKPRLVETMTFACKGTTKK